MPFHTPSPPEAPPPSRSRPALLSGNNLRRWRNLQNILRVIMFQPPIHYFSHTLFQYPIGSLLDSSPPTADAASVSRILHRSVVAVVLKTNQSVRPSSHGRRAQGQLTQYQSTGLETGTFSVTSLCPDPSSASISSSLPPWSLQDLLLFVRSAG